MLSTLDGVALRPAGDGGQHRPISARLKPPSAKRSKTSWPAEGYSIVEVLSTCPTNWGMTPQEALQGLRDKMIPYYPLGVYKDVTKEEQA